MGKLKIVEILLSAVSALVTAAKSIIRFICCIGKVKQEPAGNTA